MEWEPAVQYDKVSYPSGLAVETTDGKLWYIKDAKRFRIPSVRVLDSWAFNTLAAAIPEVLADYKISGILGFRDGTLIQEIGDGKIYLISGNKKRHIVSPDAFDRYGLNRDLVVEVSAEEALLHNAGESLE